MTPAKVKRTAIYTAEEIAANKKEVAIFRELRINRGMSQRQLSNLAGIDESGLRRIELGQTRPTWDTRQKIRKALELPDERHHTIEERNEIFMSLQDEIQRVVKKNWRTIRAVHGDPEDVCQELYLEALRAIDRYIPSEKASVKTFVMRNAERYINRIIIRQYRHGLTGPGTYPLDQIFVISMDALAEAGMQFAG